MVLSEFYVSELGSDKNIYKILLLINNLGNSNVK